MAQAVYFDVAFSEFVKKIASMGNIPKYYKNTQRISKEDLFEPLRLLRPFIPDDIKSLFSDDQIKAFLIPAFKSGMNCNPDKKEIVFKGHKYTEENKKSFAYFLGVVFSKIVTKRKEIEGVPSEKIFSLDCEYLDYDTFFGYFFEFLYILEKLKEIELKQTGVVVNTPDVVNNAIDIFQIKYLNIFLESSKGYETRQIEYKTRTTRIKDGNNPSDCQDGASELQKKADTPVDELLRTRLVSFNEVLELICMDLSDNKYKEFLTQVLYNNGKETEPLKKANYDNVSSAFEGFNEQNKKLQVNL